MRATVVLLPSIEEQREAGDHTIIDPAGVKIPPEGMPVWANFQFNIPDDVMGYAFDIRLEDGRLVADVEMSPDATKMDKHFRFSVGGVVGSGRYDHRSHAQLVVDSFDLLSVGIVARVPHG